VPRDNETEFREPACHMTNAANPQPGLPTGGVDGFVRAVDTVSGGPPRAAGHVWPSAMRDR